MSEPAAEGAFGEFLKKKAQDFIAALAIIVFEALTALAILLVGNFMGWAIKSLVPDEPELAKAIRVIADGGSVVFFVVFVIKDVWEYFKRR